MKTILKYAIPLVILAGIFLAGRYSAPDNTDELKENWKQERKLLMEGIIKKQAEVTNLRADSLAITEKMLADSLRYADLLLDNERAYNILQKEFNEINLNRADAHVLDSLVSGLYAE